MNGFIALHRKFKEWQWYKDPVMSRVFVNLLLSANWEDGEFQGYAVRRGQCVTTYPLMIMELGLTENQVRHAIDRLVKSGEITKEVFQRFTIVTICKYDEYQNTKDGNENTSHPASHPKTQNGHTQNHTQESNERHTQKTNAKDCKSENYNDVKKLRHTQKNEVDNTQHHTQNSDFVTPSVTPSNNLNNNIYIQENECTNVHSQKKADEIDFEGLVKFWNDSVDLHASQIPKIKTMTETRKKIVRARLKDLNGDKLKMVEILNAVFESDFLNGKNTNGRKWNATFDWVFKESNFVKITEGNYTNETIAKTNLLNADEDVFKESIEFAMDVMKNPLKFD